MTCAVLGDSIAVGVGFSLPACHVAAQVGISSPAYARHRVDVQGDFAVISLGSNDGSTNPTAALESIRAAITAPRVVWLLPNVGARQHVLEVARRHGDRVVDIRPYVGRDGVHPTGAGYKALARNVTIL